MSKIYSITHQNWPFPPVQFTPSFALVIRQFLTELAIKFDPSFPSTETKYKSDSQTEQMYQQETIYYGREQQGVSCTYVTTEPESYYDTGTTSITVQTYGLQNLKIQISSNSSRNGTAYTFTTHGEERLAKSAFVILKRLHALLPTKVVPTKTRIATNELITLLKS